MLQDGRVRRFLVPWALFLRQGRDLAGSGDWCFRTIACDISREVGLGLAGSGDWCFGAVACDVRPFDRLRMNGGSEHIPRIDRLWNS